MLTHDLSDHTLEQLVRAKLHETYDDVDPESIADVYTDVVRRTDAETMRYVLDRFGGNQVWAARALGINRNTLRKRMALYGLPLPGKEMAYEHRTATAV